MTENTAYQNGPQDTGPTPEESGDNTDPPIDDEDNSSTTKSKLRTLGIASSLGVGGYAASIAWTIPIRESTTLPWLQLTVASQLMMNYLALALGAVTIGYIYLRASGRSINYIDFHIPDKRQLSVIVGGTLCLLVAFFLIGAGTSFFEGISASEHSMQQTVTQGDTDPKFILLMIPISFLVIGPSEEFIFRNLVQKRLYDDFSKRLSIALASLIFALVHFPTYATGPLPDIAVSLGSVFIFSSILGVAYALTDNMLIPSVMHGTYNAIIFANWYTTLALGFTFL